MRPGATSIIDVHGRCSEETSESVSTTSALMCADVSSEQKRAAEFCLCLAEFCQVGCRLVLASARRPLALAQQVGQLCNVCGNAPRFVFAKQLRR
jgi:hypothetical protein